MKAHVVHIETLSIPAGEGHYDQRFRWHCSCGQIGPWRDKVLSARRGGEQHRAKREK